MCDSVPKVNVKVDRIWRRSLFVTITLTSFGVLLILMGAKQASAAQIDATLVPEYNNGSGTFSIYKFIEIQYPPSSSFAKELDGKKERTSLFVNGTTNSSSEREIISAINAGLASTGSFVRVNNLDLRYTSTLRGGNDRAEIAIKLDLIPTFSRIVLAGGNTTNSNMSASPFLVDMNWRGFVISEPIYVLLQNGSRINVNSAAQALRFEHISLAQELLSANKSGDMLNAPLIDFSQIGMVDLNRWDSLFDPTRSIVTGNVSLSSSQQMGSAKVISVYSLGECSLKQNCPPDQETFADATIHGTSIKLHSITPKPNAQIQIAGYAKVGSLGNSQVLYVTLSNAAVGTNELFPLQVLIVLGGMMGGIALFVLMKARK